MGLKEDEVYLEYMEMMLQQIENGYYATEEECKYLLDCLFICVKKGMELEKRSFAAFKRQENFFSAFLDSLHFGSSYIKNYLCIRKGMNHTMDHNQRILDGIHITSNYMTNNNMYILAKQRNLKVSYDQYLGKFMEQLSLNLISDDSDSTHQSKTYLIEKMNETRTKILELSYRYESKK